MSETGQKHTQENNTYRRAKSICLIREAGRTEVLRDNVEIYLEGSGEH